MQFTDDELELFKRVDPYDKTETSVYCQAKNPSSIIGTIGPRRGFFTRDYFAPEERDGIRRYRLYAIYKADTNGAYETDTNAVSDYFLTFLGIEKEWDHAKEFCAFQSLVHVAYTKRSLLYEDHTPKNGFNRSGLPLPVPEFIDPGHNGCGEIVNFIAVSNRMRHFSYENAWLYSVSGCVDSVVTNTVSSSYTLTRCKFDRDDDESSFTAFVESLLSINRASTSHINTLADIAVEGLRIDIKIEANKTASEKVDDRCFYEEAFANSRAFVNALQAMPFDAMLGVQMNLYSCKLPMSQSCLFYPIVVMHRAGLPAQQQLIPGIHPYFIAAPGAREVDLYKDYKCQGIIRLIRLMAPRAYLLEPQRRPKRKRRSHY